MSEVFFIAEAGKNFIDHDWEGGPRTPAYYIERAEMLVRAAKEAGADAIKFQCHVFVDEQFFRGEHRHKWIKFNEYVTTKQFWDHVKGYCDTKGIEFMCTPMSALAAEKIKPYLKTWKIASGNVTDIKLLEYIATTEMPVILSTGMSTQVEVDNALEILKSNRTSLLYCKSIYPANPQHIDFRTINLMKSIFGLPIGFSDHTLDITMPMKSVIFGAELVEKHFTLDRDAIGPDHKVSLLPDELKWAVKLVRDFESYKDKDVAIWPEEEEIRIRMKFNS